MNNEKVKPRVIIRDCPEYDTQIITDIIRDGIRELNINPSGSVLIKPNVVGNLGHKITPVSFTRPEVLDAIIDAIQDYSINNINVGERSGITFPTRLGYARSGYMKLFRKKRKNIKARACYFEEDKLKKVSLKNGKVHKELHLSKTFIESDFKIYATKLKSNPFTKMTNAIKHNIGILIDAERVIEHHYNLNEKIVDLLEVGFPDLIVVDAIDIGENSSAFSCTPKRIGVIIISDNPVAVDSLVSQALGYKEGEVEHILVASQRGYGPLSLNDIDITGDVSFAQLQKRCEGWKPGICRAELQDTKIKFYIGNPYCIGGCHGSINDAIEILRAFTPDIGQTMKPMSIVIGEYNGDIISDDRPILLFGKCTKVNGSISGKVVEKLDKCPVPSSTAINNIVRYGKIKNPYLMQLLDIRNAVPFIVAKFKSKGRVIEGELFKTKLLNKIFFSFFPRYKDTLSED